MAHIIGVTDDRSAAAHQAAQWRKLTVEQVLDSPHTLIGRVDPIGNELLHRREQWGISDIVVPELFMEPFAGVLAHLAGR